MRYAVLPWAAALAALAALTACSPTYDWREAPLDELRALLPCKPDRAERALPGAAAAGTVVVRMAGCTAGGQTFAIARAEAADAGAATKLLVQWRRATRSGFGLPADAPAAAPGAPSAPFAPAGSPAWPGAQRERLAGATQAAEAAWFAHAAPGGAPVRVYQALVLGTADAAVADTFFSGLRIAP